MGNSHALSIGRLQIVTSEEWEINLAAFRCVHHMRDTTPTQTIHHHVDTLS